MPNSRAKNAIRANRYEYMLALHVAMPSLLIHILDQLTGDKKELAEYQLDQGVAYMKGWKPIPTETDVGWSRLHLIKDNAGTNTDTAEVWLSPDDERGFCHYVVPAICPQPLQGETDEHAQSNTPA